MAAHHPGGAIVLGAGRTRRLRRRPSGLVDLLAHGAAPLHERLAGRLDLPGALRDRAHYAALLSALLHAWTPIEAALAGCAVHGILGMTDPGHCDLLRRDLIALGAEADDDEPRRPVAMGLPEAVGTVYVREGTAVGLPVMAPLVERHLGLATGEATAFLRGAGAGTARRWASACRAIDAWGRGCTGAEADRAVWGAQLTLAITGSAMAGALDRPA